MSGFYVPAWWGLAQGDQTPDSLIVSGPSRGSEGGFWDLVGIDSVSALGGRATARVELGPQHLNYNGVVHGGVISSLVDSAAGFAVRSHRPATEVAARPHATADLHVTYLAAARGTCLEAQARVLRAGRTAIFTEVVVVDDRSVEVARGSVTYVIGPGTTNV